MLRDTAGETGALEAGQKSGTATSLLTIDVRELDGRTCVILTGELDDASASPLQDRLADVTGDLGGDLVLDIAGLTFVDSTGLSLFVVLHKNLESAGHQLVLLGPTPMARRLFEITKLDGLLCIEPTQP